jgi:hypothetical protein
MNAGLMLIVTSDDNNALLARSDGTFPSSVAAVDDAMYCTINSSSRKEDVTSWIK